jgi:hypothetical protein
MSLKQSLMPSALASQAKISAEIRRAMARTDMELGVYGVSHRA